MNESVIYCDLSDAGMTAYSTTKSELSVLKVYTDEDRPKYLPEKGSNVIFGKTYYQVINHWYVHDEDGVLLCIEVWLKKQVQNGIK